jgi:nucleoside-diphosphate-sugar epimerase
LSSIAVYGANCASIGKETLVHPITNYGIQKLEFEEFLSRNQGSNKLLIIRFTNLMNFKDKNSLPLKIFNEMVNSQIGKELVLSETRDLIYYREAVEATNRVIEKMSNEEEIEKKVLIMGSGVSISIPKLVKLFRDAVKNLDQYHLKTSYTHPIPRVSIQTDNWYAAYGQEFRQYTEEELVESTLKYVHYPRDSV